MAKTFPFEKDTVRGFLHRPDHANEHGVVLTHGAGSDCRAALLVEAANAFSAAGFHVLRCDLPFRQQRRSGPPSPATAAADRAGLRDAVEAMRCIVPGAVFLGGHSYGGRQASILAADQPEAAAALLLLSYPLHPPGKASQLRTEHFARLRVPAVFVHGVRDPFGSIEELRAALSMVSVQTQVIPVEGAGHDLKRGRFDLASVVTGLVALMGVKPGIDSWPDLQPSV